MGTFSEFVESLYMSYDFSLITRSGTPSFIGMNVGCGARTGDPLLGYKGRRGVVRPPALQTSPGHQGTEGLLHAYADVGLRAEELSLVGRHETWLQSQILSSTVLVG